jgi:hypothetical protein
MFAFTLVVSHRVLSICVFGFVRVRIVWLLRSHRRRFDYFCNSSDGYRHLGTTDTRGDSVFRWVNLKSLEQLLEFPPVGHQR